MLDVNKLTDQINQWGTDRTPFLLLVDFEMQKPLALPLSAIDPEVIRYDFRGHTNASKQVALSTPELSWKANFVSTAQYKRAFDVVQKGLNRGDSFLTNLTFSTDINTSWSLMQVFEHSKAAYRLFWKDNFAVFSPETFVQIKDNRIYSFPMKGTLSAYLPKQMLLDNPKEKAEHATIVDLMRNDLSMVADHVQVDRYRYVERIKNNKGDLWQTSSQISGNLPSSFNESLGKIIMKLLPAGSVSGAPKEETLSLIRQAESENRGYYTGVAFLWDGHILDSCVLIRFLHKSDNQLKYWSGGGITAYSNWEEEYKELKEKVYLPVERKYCLQDTIDLY